MTVTKVISVVPCCKVMSKGFSFKMMCCVGSAHPRSYFYVMLLASQLHFTHTDGDEALIYSYKIAHIWIDATPDVTSLLTHDDVATNVECIAQCDTDTYTYAVYSDDTLQCG